MLKRLKMKMNCNNALCHTQNELAVELHRLKCVVQSVQRHVIWRKIKKSTGSADRLDRVSIIERIRAANNIGNRMRTKYGVIGENGPIEDLAVRPFGGHKKSGIF